MNEKFNKNARVEKFTNMLGIAVRLIVIDLLLPCDFDLRIWPTLKNNIDHNVQSRKDRTFILHMCISCNKTIILTLTLEFELILINIKFDGYFIMIIATRWTLLSSDNSYSYRKNNHFCYNRKHSKICVIVLAQTDQLGSKSFVVIAISRHFIVIAYCIVIISSHYRHHTIALSLSRLSYRHFIAIAQTPSHYRRRLNVLSSLYYRITVMAQSNDRYRTIVLFSSHNRFIAIVQLHRYRTILLSSSHNCTIVIALSHYRNRTIVLWISHNHIFVIAPSHHRYRTIFLSHGRNRIDIAPSFYWYRAVALSASLCRIFSIVLSHYRHRTFASLNKGYMKTTKPVGLQPR